MTPSEDLFKLIRSLTPNEKGYFKKFSRIHVREGKNNYMLLFEAIEKQEVYDEQALIHKFRNEQFVKQFPVAKNYLYNLILKALDVYHSGVDLEIGYLIHCSIILTDKAMYEPALKFLKKAEVLAREHHKLSYLNKVLNHELYILRRDPSSKKKELLDAHYRQRVENADQLRYVIEYQHLNDLMNEQYHKAYGIQRAEAMKEGKKLMQHTLMKKLPEDLSLYALIEYHTGCMLYQRICQDHQKAFVITAELVNQVLKKNEHILSARTRAMLLEHHCISCIAANKYEEAQRMLDRLRQIETKHELERLALFQFIHLHDLIISLGKGNYTEGAKVIEQAEKELSGPGEQVEEGYKGELLYLITLTLFANGQYKDALKWVNRMLNSKLSAYRSDIVSSFKLMELLVFYETDKNDIIQYKIESFERAFKKDREKHQYELLVIAQFKKLVQLQQPADRAAQAKKGIAELDSYLEKNTAALDIFYRLDLRDWLQSKVSGKAMAQVLAGK
jgi:hypothetical protein